MLQESRNEHWIISDSVGRSIRTGVPHATQHGYGTAHTEQLAARRSPAASSSGLLATAQR